MAKSKKKQLKKRRKSPQKTRAYRNQIPAQVPPVATRTKITSLFTQINYKWVIATVIGAIIGLGVEYFFGIVYQHISPENQLSYTNKKIEEVSQSVKKSIESSNKSIEIENRLVKYASNNYTRLNEVFTEGYNVYAEQPNEPVIVWNYVGKFTSSETGVQIDKKEHPIWHISILEEEFSAFIRKGRGPLYGQSIVLSGKVNFHKPMELQGIQFHYLTDDDTRYCLAFLLLKHDKNNPVYAIGLTDCNKIPAYTEIKNSQK